MRDRTSPDPHSGGSRAPAIVVPGFHGRHGVHCETTATGSLLGHAGLELSEPMLFGLGEGLSFILLNLKDLPLPLLGGRTRPFEVTRALGRNLGLPVTERRTSSRAVARRTLEADLSAGQPVGLQVDMFPLEYVPEPVHFAGHFVAVYGLDGDDVLLLDTAPLGGLVRTSRASLEAARFAKGPMAAPARSWTIAVPEPGAVRLADVLGPALRGNAEAYLSPPFGGATFRGIRALATTLPRWFERGTPEDLRRAAAFMDEAGTGGALFRRLYRDFLAEAADHLPGDALPRARERMTSAARMWSEVAGLIDRAGREASPGPLREAARLCHEIADVEIAAMTLLAEDLPRRA